MLFLFYRCLKKGVKSAVNPAKRGTKVAAHYIIKFEGKGEAVVRLRMRPTSSKVPSEKVFSEFSDVFLRREKEMEEFYSHRINPRLSPQEKQVALQAYAGLLHSKQFYHYVVKDWLEGDSNFPKPPSQRLNGRNNDWKHFFAKDVIIMPDKWEYVKTNLLLFFTPFFCKPTFLRFFGSLGLLPGTLLSTL